MDSIRSVKWYSNTNLDIVRLGIGGCSPPNLHIGSKRESGLPHFQYSHGSDSLNAALDKEKKSVSTNWEVPEIAVPDLQILCLQPRDPESAPCF